MDYRFNKIKAIFLDIDGTITTTDKQITGYTKEIIGKLKQKDIYAVLCSGRTNSYVYNLSKKINASKYEISSNGAYVYNYEDDKDIFISVMDLKKIEKLWRYCEKEEAEILINCKNKRYANSTAFRRFSREAVKIRNLTVLKNEKITQIVIETKTEEKSNEIKKLIEQEEGIRIANYGKVRRMEDKQKRIEYFFDINNEGINKGIGIEQLISFLGIKKEETICFGDSVNDYNMFEKCGIGVAMGNARQELKDMSDYVALSNDEDGVAKFIEKYIL